MSEIYVVPLNQEWCSVSFNHEFINAIRGRGLKPEIEQLYTVGTIRHGSEESSSYLMAEISHLEAPLDEVDIVNVERKTSFCCGCAGWKNHCYDEQIGAPIDDCKHVERAQQKLKTTVDDNQETLIP